MLDLTASVDGLLNRASCVDGLLKLTSGVDGLLNRATGVDGLLDVAASVDGLGELHVCGVWLGVELGRPESDSLVFKVLVVVRRFVVSCLL